jgi:tetratricopeptide (TPR) repeat protein
MFHRALVLFTFVLFCVVFAVAQHPLNDRVPSGLPNDDVISTVSGSVRTFDNRPAANARVEVRNVETGQTVASAYTNDNGTFDINSIPNGSYEISAVSGLDEARERLEMRGGAGSVVSLRLPRPEGSQAGNADSVSVAQFKVPGKARAAFKKAESAMNHQKTDEAQKYVAEALQGYPEYAEALTLRGILKLDANDAAGAAADLEHAVKADPSYSLAYIALGAVYNTQSKFEDAARTIDRGIALSPRSWQGYFEMGKALLGKGDYQASVRQLTKAESLGPREYPLLHLVKAHALLGMKDYPEAMAELETYLQKAPPDDQVSAEARQTLAKVKAFAGSNPGK